MLKTVGAALVVGLTLVGLATASSQSETYRLSAKLTPGAEVPKPKGVPANATGSFTGTTVEPKSGKVQLTWKLAFAHLSGSATQAHIHLGKRGAAGNVLVLLCTPCRSGQTGKTLIARSVERNLEAGRTYVNVHTAKNPGGEIRGQIKVTSG